MASFRRTARASTQVQKNLFAKEQNRLDQYMKKSNIPPWYRGMSEYQMQAGNQLLASLRDDCEQETSHRVRRRLSVIGLQPMIGDKDAKFLMKLSRGNDLAFLWFLLEVFYKTPNQNYSLNEQLILTLICHLDMITTLKELDRILPPPQLSKEEIQINERKLKNIEIKQKRIEIEKKARASQILRQKGEKYIKWDHETQSTKFPLPYFEKLRKPIRQGTKFTFKPKSISLYFGFYENYSNPNYVVPNETNRWYSKENIMKAGRNNEGNYENLNFTYTIIRNTILQSILKSEKAENGDEKTAAASCEHHKVIQDLEMSLKHELNVIARNNCLNYFDVNKKRKELCRKRITTQLENDVNMCLSKFRKMTEPMRRLNCSVGKEDTLHVIDKCDTCCSYNINEIDQMTDDEAPVSLKCKHGFSTIQIIDEGDGYHTHKVADINQNDKNDKRCATKCLNTGGKKQQRIIDVLKTCGAEHTKSEQGEKTVAHIYGAREGMGNIDNYNHSEINHKYHNKQKRKPEAGDNNSTDKRENGGDCANIKCKTKLMHKKASKYCGDSEYIENYDYGHCDAKSVSSEEKFFESPDDHMPFQFDYRKIFQFKTATFADEDDNADNGLNTDMLNTKIKEAAAKAVDSSINFQHSDSNAPIDMNAIVSNFAHKAFKEQVKLTQEPEDSVVIDPNKLRFPKGFYDPDDTKLMHSMLKDALKHMTSDPKFVLAAMPDADKVPVLRLWIYRRYGKRYSREELSKIYRESTRIFHALDTLTLNVAMPTTNEMGNKLFVSYSCRNYIVKKTKHLRRIYYNLLDNTIMDQSRCLWFAMRPYHCYKPPRNTFFAYMPASPKDIYHFRAWDPSEFIDAYEYRRSRIHSISERQSQFS